MHFKRGVSMKSVWVVMILTIMISGCEKKYAIKGCPETLTASEKELRENYPKVEVGKKIDKAAKIYNYKDGEILLINEKNKGIHVVNNHIKGKVTKSDTFINIPGNIDMAVKDGYLYADSFMDLLVFDIRDLANIKLVTRKEDAFRKDTYQMQRDYEMDHDNACYGTQQYDDNTFIIGYK
jgi:hypothetical protein